MVIPTGATSEERSGQSRHWAVFAARFLDSPRPRSEFARNDRKVRKSY